MSDKCPGCGKTVYAMERVGAVGKNWHKQCLKCMTCSKVVRNGQFNDHDGQVYCNACYEKSFVDEETKQIVYDMEATYAKKVHGTAVNILGGGPGPIPAKLAKVETNTASAPLSMNNNYNYNDNDNGAPPPPPMKTISSALSNAIVQSGGKVQKSGGSNPNIQPSRSYQNIRKSPEYNLEDSAPPPIIQRNQNGQRPMGNGNSAPTPPARKVVGNNSRQMIDDEPPRSVPAPPRLVQNTPSGGGPQKLKTSRSYENLRKANTDSDLPPPPSISLPVPPKGPPSRGAPPPLVKRKY